MSVATWEAPANIAFVKYWGARNLEEAIPRHPSISMTLSSCVSRTTVECLAGAGADEVWLLSEGGGAERPGGTFEGRVLDHLERLRRHAGRRERLRVLTRNSFPAAAGMASSASGFAALTLAALDALGVETTPAELSELARRSGSGSAARSVLGGYVEWPAGDLESCHAEALARAEHWDLRDVVASIQDGPKEVSSLEGHRRAPTSPHYARRLELVEGRLREVRGAIEERSLERLGPVLEEDALELHLVAMSSRPPILYWAPATLAVLARVRGLREEGVVAWYTMDAGANVHVICPPEDEPRVARELAAVSGVRDVIRDGVGPGPRRLEEPLPGPVPGESG